MSCHKSRLIESILTEYFGPTVAAVGTRLHQCGRSTVPQLMAALKAELRRKNSSDATKCSISLSSFSLAGVRDCLFVLMQHHLVTFAEDGSQFIYQLNVPAVMEMLRYPRIIEFTKMKFGELACGIVSQLAAHGRATPAQICEAMPGSNLKEIHAVMKQMLDFRFLRVVTRADSLTVNDVRLAEEAKRIADTDLVTLVNTKSTARGGKRAAEDNYFDQMACKRMKTLDERVDDNTYYAINVPRFTVEFRHSMVMEYATKKVNQSAASILDCLYQEGVRHYSKPEADDRTPGMTIMKLFQSLPKEVPFSVQGFAGGSSEKTRQLSINQYLEVLSHPPFNLIFKTLVDSGREGFVVNYAELIPIITQSLIEAHITDSMGSISTRLYRVIREKKILDDKTLSKLALMSQKDVRERMLRLFQLGIVEMQEVPRSADRAPARTIFLWKLMSTRTVCRALLYRAYKCLANLRDRRAHEMSLRKLLLKKLERSDVAADHSLLSPEEQNELRQYEHRVDRLSLAELQLEEEIMLLRDLQL